MPRLQRVLMGLRQGTRVSAGLGILLVMLAASLGARRAGAQGVPQFQVVSLPPCQAAGQIVDVDFSTALSIVPGSQDPRWYLSSVPPSQAGAFPTYSTNSSVAWVTPTSPAHWIQRIQDPNPQVDTGGTYIYRLQLNINTALYSNLHIVGQYAADNTVTVQLNGVTKASCSGGGCFQTLQPLSATSGFLNGVNHLDVIVFNISNITGTLVQAKLEATCLACVAAPSGMVAWYPLDEHTGATAINDIASPPSSMVNNVGTPQPWPVGPIGPHAGPAPVVGKVGAGALYFYGPYVEVAPQAELDFGTGAFSIDGWVRAVRCNPLVFSPIVDKLATGPSTGFSLYLAQNPPSVALLKLQVNGSTFTSTGSLTANANPILNTGPWYHLAVTVDRTPGGGTFYINGSPSGTFTPPAGTVTNTVPMWIGKSRVPGSSCEIAIDELEIFNRALTQPEVLGIFNAGSAGKCRPTSELPSDLGDAPDSTNHPQVPMLAYPSPPVTAHFPTVHDPALPGWRGPKHLDAKGALWLGPDVSFEDEADMGGDQDGVNNLDPSSGAANQDNQDDGVNPNAVLLPTCGSTQLTFGVTAAPAAPGGNYYVNVWFDFTRDGDWDDSFRCAMGPTIDARGQEWAVQNMTVNVPGMVVPGGSATLTTPSFVSYNPASGPMWMRITISDQPVIASDNGGPFTAVADLGRAGSVGTIYPNGYSFGETEDYLLEPRRVEVCGVKWHDRNANGVQETGELPLAGWEIHITDSAGNLVGAALTDQQGSYCVTVPAPGPGAPPVTYAISEVAQAAWTQTFPSAPGTHTVTISPGPPLSISPPGPYNFGNRTKEEGGCDMAINKEVQPTPLMSGQQATIVLTVTNVSNVACEGVTTMTDALPTGLQVASVAQGGSLWNCSVTGANPPATVSCTWDASIQPVPPGPLPPITITANVTAPPGSRFRNCATVGNANDTNPANDQSCVTTLTSQRTHRRLNRP